MFTPKKPEDVLVTERFAPGGMAPQNLALVERVEKDQRDWLDRMQKQGAMVPDLYSSDLCLQGQTAEIKGDTAAALAKYKQGVDLLDKDRRKLRDEQARGAFMENKIDCYYRPARLLLDQKRYPEAFAFFERSRSRAMADTLASRPLSLGAEKERTLFAQLETLKVTIAAQQKKVFNLAGSPDRDQHTKEIGQLEGQIAGLQQQYQELDTRIAREAPKLKELTASEAVTLESVQRSAAEGRYDVLYYVVFEANWFSGTSNGSEVQVKDVFLPHDQLIKKIAALHDSLVARRDGSNPTFDEETSRQLYFYLIQPVLSYIKSSHLLIIPQEELNSIPFQALQNPKTGQYVGDNYEISSAPSATVLGSLEQKPNLSSGRLLAVADPEIHDASEEVRAIGMLYPGRSKVVAQAAANKADIKAWVGHYNVVHLSVHGQFNSSDPLLSYLQFKEMPSDNGRLTAAEMFGLPLQKHSLVVLSACETGRVEATHAGEVLGMVRSLLYAGADNLVLSSWEVDAASTKLWMETFYREGQTNSPAAAARLALVAVKSRPEFSHPFFWAPFVMTGK